jgi:hypothetical protein
MQGDGTSVTGAGFVTQNIMYAGWENAPTSTASVYGATIIDIYDYTSTSIFKTIRSFSGSAPATTLRVSVFSGSYQATTAVTSLSLLSPNTTTKPFETASRFSLYGIKV